MFLRPSLAKQTSVTEGSASAIVLQPNAGDTNSFQSVLGSGPVRCRYMVRGVGYFLHCRGTFTAPDQLTRDEFIETSNSDNDVAIPPGTSDVYLLDYYQFLPERFSTNKTLTNKDGSNTWLFTGSSAAALTMPSISTALPDFWGFVKNIGTAILTLTGNGSDTFDESAATTLRLFPGESGFLFLDVTGAIWRFVRTGTIAPNPNKIINGDMRVNQRNLGTISTGTGGYSLDRWQSGYSAAAKFSYGPSSDVPPGFTTSMLHTSLSAYSAGAAESFLLYQKIEGLNCIDLGWGAAGAKPVAVSFWVKASQTGNYSFALRNSAGNRSYVTTYNVAQANTWEFKTIIVPGDTSGTWLVDTGIGLRVEFDLGSGSNFQTGSTNAWQAASVMRASGSISVVGTNTATHRITGVKVETGSIVTPFVTPDYAAELARCQRYLHVVRQIAGGNYYGWGRSVRYQATGTAHINLPTPVTLRANPTVTTTGAHGFVADNATQQSSSLTAYDQTLSNQNSVCMFVTCSGLSGDLPGSIGAYNSASAAVIIDAEL